MKIAFVFPPMWSPHSDGSLSIWNREITTRLSKSCDVRVYSAIFDDSKHDESIEGVSYRRFSTRLDGRLMRYVVEYIHRALGLKRPLFSTDLWYVGYALKVALDLRKEPCDVVHIYNYPQFAHIIKRLNPSLRVVLNMHGEWLAQIAFANLQERLREVDLIISCSDLVTRSTAAKFPGIANRCSTVPMGVAPDAFSHTGDSPDDKRTHARKLLYVGRISPEKGVHVLLDAFELIHQQYPDASLTIVGPEAVAAREHIVDLCLDRSLVDGLIPFYKNGYLSQLKQRLSPDAAKSVTFSGFVAHSEIPKYYSAADVYISPSLYESFGMSIIEAMAVGLPVVTTRVGAVPELISHGRSGLIVDTANPVAIAHAVAGLFADHELRDSISCAARDRVSRQFSWQNICSVLAQLYRDVLSDAPRSQRTEPSFENAPVKA